MMYKTHLVFALFIGNFLFSYFSESFLFLALVCVGALLPDIDHPESFFGRRIKPLSIFISQVFGHRGFFHSLFVPLLLYGIFSIIFESSFVGVSLGVGYLSHLVGDSFTQKGVNFLHPFSTFRVSSFLITGGILEYVVFLGLFFTDLYLLSGYLF